MNATEIVARLKELSRPDQLEGMARYGINTQNALAVRIPELRKIARENGRDHDVALDLWATGIHEARILAAMICEPQKATNAQLEEWVADFNSWDLCDQVCSNFFDKTAFAWDKAREWSGRNEDFVKRAGFTLMACLAVHDKQATDAAFLDLLPIIERQSIDGRNYVKKAVNWALRGIGKRNRALHAAALALSQTLLDADDKAARWIGRDAHRELSDEKTLSRLKG
ncbi:MAG: DNA alkylation repair protein [Rhodospirillales bacterium]|jgi:3-methyladenine DNA glycosylase AlkD|nr:DNA alkylation repair protein [Rhodospirillales bacterium]